MKFQVYIILLISIQLIYSNASRLLNNHPNGVFRSLFRLVVFLEAYLENLKNENPSLKSISKPFKNEDSQNSQSQFLTNKNLIFLIIGFSEY